MKKYYAQRVDWSCSIRINSQSELDVYLVHYRGRIFIDDESDDDIEAGTVEAIRVNIGNMPSFDLMDFYKASVYEFYPVLFDPDSEYYRDELVDGMGGSDLLIMERMEIHEQFRGYGLGKMVIDSTITSLGSSCAVIAMKIFPLQYVKKGMSTESPEFTTIQNKMKKYWRTIGFEDVPGHKDFMYLDGSLVRPSANFDSFVPDVGSGAVIPFKKDDN